MADAIPITPVRGGAPSSHSAPCPQFGAAVQAVERLLQADERAADLPYGDPPYQAQIEDADVQLGIAITAARQACDHAEEAIYRDAAETMHSMLVSTDAETLRAARDDMRRLEMEAYTLIDRTVRLSVTRAAEVMESLYRLWAIDADGRALDGYAASEDPEDADLIANFDDMDAITAF